MIVDGVFAFGRVTNACQQHLQAAGAAEVIVACLAATQQ
jgi:predicted amidophosphoribosyltransferase